MVGEGARVLVRRALAAAGIGADETRALERFLRIYSQRLLNFTILYPGIADTVEDLSRRCRLAVLTNKPLEPSRRILAGLGLLTSFREIVGGDSLIRAQAGSGGAPPPVRNRRRRRTSTLLVGDSTIDVQTAANAGTHMCLARYGFGYRGNAESVHRHRQSGGDGPG